MSEYDEGGYIGGTVSVRMVAEVRPTGGGDLLRIYADECFIGLDGVCRRGDDLHRAVDIDPERFWTCLAHD
jgi:hypothetical protein